MENNIQKWKYREHIDKQGKFRVGDLIQLSSYGRKTDQNKNVYFDGNEIGLILSIEPGCDRYPIKIHWLNIPNKNIASKFFFRELKLKRI